MKNHTQIIFKACLFGLGMVIALIAPQIVMAETPAEACARMAGDSVKLDAIPAGASESCAAAVAAAPQDKQLQYDYARALENGGQRDQAKQVYQWIAGDGFAPATAALARMADPLTGDAADREKFAQKLDAIAAIAARIAKTTPRDHDDPNTVLAKTGKDPAKILAWVKANTRIVPYAGMLRGSSGVLMDRSGNSLDRALFLADLLNRAGYNVRIARAQISPQVAEALRVRFVNAALKPMPSIVPNKSALLKAIATDPRLDPKLIEKAVDETIAGSQKFDADVQNLYGKILPVVLQSIGNDPARDARLAADADAVLRDHFWVQQQNSAGWDDLDPDADIAGNPAATSTFAPGETPSNLKQRVTLRLTLETLKSGKLSEAPLLQQSWLPSEVAGKPIVISHGLFPQVPLDGLLKHQNPQADFIEGLADATAVVPVLQVGAQTTRGQIYDFDGKIEAPTPTNLASMGGTAIVGGTKLASGIESVFGDIAPPPANTSQATVTAEWLEIDVTVPGKPVEKQRRAIFDLIGAAARANPSSVVAPAITDSVRRQRALALGVTIDASVFNATPSSDWIQRISMDGTSRAMTLAAKTARTAQSLAGASPQAANRIEPQLWAWAENRAASSLLTESVPVAPNIALLWQTAAPQPDAPDYTQLVFDIVTNGAASDTSFAHRVAQGVMDTIIERAVLGDTDQTATNAAAQHAADLAAGRSWKMLKSAQDLQAPPEAKLRIQSELGRGDMVIAPDGQRTGNADRFTWWRIDPANGQTLGIGSTGMGQSMLEYAENMLVGGIISCQIYGIGMSIAMRVWVGAVRIAACANPAVGYGLIFSKATGVPVLTVVEALASGAVSGGGYVLFGSK